ncbi:hypothetical protein F5883DRAFT_595244 [Diaporthe sp. PMI_573]|nr:hypothetical protein F5883DRAFT_595244 [Diaporthaceae sp. PMI_573]
MSFTTHINLEPVLHNTYTMRTPPLLPTAGTTEAEVADVDASESDEVIHLDTITKSLDLPDAAARSKDRPSPASFIRTPHANLQRETRPKRILKRDSAPKRRRTRQNGGSRLSGLAKTPSSRTSRSDARAPSSKFGHAVSAAISDHLVIIGWTRDGTCRKVQASFDSAGQFSFRLYDSPDHRNGRKGGNAAAVTIEEIELVPRFQGKNRDEVRSEVQKFLENELGLSADCGEV